MRGLRKLVLAAAVLSTAAAGFVLGNGSTARAQAGCSLEMVRGAYAASGSGIVVVPWAIMGTVVFDGAGQMTATVIESYGGVIDDATWRGTYSVGPDCRGSLLVTNMEHKARAGSVHVPWRVDNHKVEFVATAGGQRMYWLLVDTYPTALPKGLPEASDPTITASGLLERV
jgi:hypothetical protein